MKKLVIIDSHAIIHRAYHALPPLTTPKGEPAGAVYGFTSILLRMLRELAPEYIAAAFDMPGPTFRHEEFADYKAHRTETPDELKSQFAKVREVLVSFGVPVLERAGYEADDIIGTVVKKMAPKKDVEVVVVTGDMDILQLVGPRVSVYSMKKGLSEFASYDRDSVKERYGFGPEGVVEYKALRGDPSDNIPGVKGIGEKTAVDLIQRFGTVDGVYKALKKDSTQFTKSVATKLEAGKKDAQTSRRLAQIATDVPIAFSLSSARYTSQQNSARTALTRLGFMSLVKRLENGENKKINTTAPHEQQLTLGGEVAAQKDILPVLKTAADIETFETKMAKKRVGCLFLQGELLLVREVDNAAYVVGEHIVSSKAMKTFFATHSVVVHDAKRLMHTLRNKGILMRDVSFDTLLAAYLAEPFSRDFSWETVVLREVGEGDPYTAFFSVVSSLDAKLSEGKLREVFSAIELPAAAVLAGMETRGITLDTTFLARLSRDVEKKIAALTKKIFASAGEEFNINSSQQLSHILFETLNISTAGLRRTSKNRVISTGAAELEKLRDEHEIIAHILEYREYTKLKSTYIDALPRLVNTKTGRVHTTFNQTGTATGRLSSSDPNLQNIPILSAYGREVRKAFVAERGWVLAAFDYSQIELRVAAHMAGDAKMIAAFQKGADIHRLTAAEIYDIRLENVTSAQRRAAKTLNFGVLYGMGPHAFAESTGMKFVDAKKFIDNYFEEFASIKTFIEEIKQRARDEGYVETLFGRRRYIPEIHSSNWQVKREAERMAVNMPVQGTATGDIIKMAMIAVNTYLQKEKLGDVAQMLLQVHDELVFEIKKGTEKKLVRHIKKIMEGVAELSVPLVVDAKVGPNWGEQKPL